jgi:hypothetical protein
MDKRETCLSQFAYLHEDEWQPQIHRLVEETVEETDEDENRRGRYESDPDDPEQEMRCQDRLQNLRR